MKIERFHQTSSVLLAFCGDQKGETIVKILIVEERRRKKS
jgi:hypothetical protein